LWLKAVKRIKQLPDACAVFTQNGDVGKALNTLILSSKTGTPPADVFYGVDNTFLSQALENELFEPYAAPALQGVVVASKLDPKKRRLAH
jgi:thiamine transport system substrate-binding protein